MKTQKQPTASAAPVTSDVAPSPNWSHAMPPGPDRRIKITKEYAKHVARDAFFWTWPLVNIYNRRVRAEKLIELSYAGPVPAAPLNRIVMLTDYVAPDERIIACPNQDVAYGSGSLGLEKSPVVIQVPEFGNRFWVYQAVDLRSDSFVQIGKMYGSTPGFYLLAGPNWHGEIPQGITEAFRASTNTGFIVPRIFMDDTAEDRQAIQPLLHQIVMYPLAEYDRTMKSIDWSSIRKLPNQATGEEEIKWVPTGSFVDTLPVVLADAPPLPGEEARYAQVLAVLDAAKSNIFVNSPKETKYFYQDLDKDGLRLNGSGRYTVTFAKGLTPPVYGFWSLTLYNKHHFFASNEINRYSVGTKNKNLTANADGSLTIYVQADGPPKEQRTNWLPAPKDAEFSLYCRAYWPKPAVIDGSWTSPPVERQK